MHFQLKTEETTSEEVVSEPAERVLVGVGSNMNYLVEVLPPDTNRSPSFGGRTLRNRAARQGDADMRRRSRRGSCWHPHRRIVTAGTVHSLLEAEGRPYPLSTVYKTMYRMSDGLGTLRRYDGGFTIAQLSMWAANRKPFVMHRFEPWQELGQTSSRARRGLCGGQVVGTSWLAPLQRPTI